MPVVIAYSIAGASLAAVITLWFVSAHQVLSRKKAEVTDAHDQMRMLRDGFDQVRGSQEERAARRMLDTSRKICEETEKSYHKILRKPIYRFPGYIMGFRTSAEDGINYKPR